MNRRLARGPAAMFIVILGLCGSLRGADLTFESVVENVKSAELLYEELDIKWTFNHENGPGALKLKPDEGSGFRPQEKKRVSAWCVNQSGMYRVQTNTEMQYQDDGSQRIENIKMYDGEMTRVLVDGKAANLREGYSSDNWVYMPHMALLRRPFYYMPLSLLLSGRAALVASPKAGWNPDFDIAYSYGGTAEWDGLTVHEVSVTLLRKNKPHLQIDLSLAEQRNFIPARASWNYLLVSKTESCEESKVLEWTEVEAGIWLPKKTHLDSYNPIYMKSGSGRKVQWTEESSVQSASLTPGYPKSFFQKLEIPNGAAVYESVGTKITSSYRKGAPETLGGPTSRNSFKLWWLVLLNVSVLVALFVFSLLRKYGPRHVNRPT